MPKANTLMADRLMGCSFPEYEKGECGFFAVMAKPESAGGERGILIKVIVA